MDFLKLFFAGPTSLLPMFATAILLGRGAYLVSRFARRRGRTRMERLKRLRFCKALVPILPLLGIMGTVLGLMKTLAYMGRKDLTSGDAMAGIIERFAPALGSTFWGVIGAALCIVFLESCVHSLEDDSDG